MTVDRTALGVWFQGLPEGWSAKRLKHLGRLKGGSGFPVQLQGDTESELAFYKVGDLAKSKDGVYLDDPAHTITRPQAKSLGARVFEEGTLVWAKIGAALLLNRRRIVSRPCCIDNNMTGFVPQSAVADPKFCYYLISAIDFSPHVKPGAVPSYSEGDQAELSVPLPPLGLQGEIASALDRETARIDALIEKKTRFIELLKEKRQALITQAVTKGLDPTVPMKDSGVEWIGEVPAHWIVPRLRWQTAIQSGIPLGGKIPAGHTRELPYLRVANVQDGHFNLETVHTITVERRQVDRYLLRVGDVLMNEGGDNDKLGRGAVWSGEIEPCLHQNHVFAVRPCSRLMPEWLTLCSQSLAAKAHFRVHAKQSTNLASISSTNIKELQIPMPPREEQAAILSQLELDTRRLDTLLDATNRSIDLLKERRSALITAAVTGQIDLREDAA